MIIAYIVAGAMLLPLGGAALLMDDYRDKNGL